jgi:hypothetical protein
MNDLLFARRSLAYLRAATLPAFAKAGDFALLLRPLLYQSFPPSNKLASGLAPD